MALEPIFRRNFDNLEEQDRADLQEIVKVNTAFASMTNGESVFILMLETHQMLR